MDRTDKEYPFNFKANVYVENISFLCRSISSELYFDIYYSMEDVFRKKHPY